VIRALALIFVLCFAAVGCARAPGGVAPSNIPLAPGGYTVIGPVKASDCMVRLLGLIPVSGGNQVSDAMAEALGHASGADALVNISVDTSGAYWILWSHNCTEVRATAVTVP
jgi:hypothetical protein